MNHLPAWLAATPLFRPTERLIPYGPSHVWALVVGVVVYGGLILWARRQSEATRWRLGAALGWIPLATLAASSGLRMLDGLWKGVEDLPFQLCHVMALTLPFALAARRYRAFEVAYFLVLAACAQSLLTPDLDQDWPHHVYIRYMLMHIGLVGGVLYAVFALGLRPERASMGRAYAALWAYGALSLGANALLGTNFGYTHHKPAEPSLLDALGPYPWYLLGEGLIALAFIGLLYAPVAIERAWQRRSVAVLAA